MQLEAAVSDAALFVLIFGGFFILRIIAATVVFCWILPKGDRCPNCDAPTLRVESRFADRVMPWFRKSWCLRCGWQGMMRRGPTTPQPSAERELTRKH